MQTEHSQSADLKIQALLRDYPAPDAVDGFYEQALLRATHEGSHRQRNRWLVTGFGSAVAAGLVLWFIGGALLGTSELPTVPDNASIPGITMTLAQPQTIRLVFASAEPLQDATLTVMLPDGIELSGFPGQREISWQTSLKAGQNLLPLNLIATSPLGGEVFATLQHDDRDQTFRLRVDVS